MNSTTAINQLRRGEEVEWPEHSGTSQFAEELDRDPSLVNFRDKFIVPTKAQLQQQSIDDKVDCHKRDVGSDDSSAIYFCGNSLGLQPKAIFDYLAAYLKTWASIAVGGHFKKMKNSPLVPYQDMAAECATKCASIVGARPDEVVIMNTLTVNLHLMMCAFYKPTSKKHKIMLEWRPFPSDYYAIESQIELRGHNPKDSMLLVEPDHGYIISTSKILELITEHADELALILLPGIQYYSGQLLDIAIITKYAHDHGITIGWDLAHAAGNVELSLHDWDVDFACWCTYKYMNAGAGAIAGAFVHERHGDVVQNSGLRGWYGGDKSVRFLMDNKFVPTPGAQGFQLSNPSIVDLTCLSASLSVFNQTSMAELRSRSLLLTAYAEHLFDKIRQRNQASSSKPPFEIITPRDPTARGAQLSVLLKEDLMEDVSVALEAAGIVCDKRKPGCIRVAPAPLYNTFTDVWQFMQVFEKAIRPQHCAVNDHDLGHG